ncbi:MAG: c-type cytochrome [Rhodobacteraceae bacterium]|nr:c-type cytochrome [Paracoccaceae bacterium]
MLDIRVLKALALTFFLSFTAGALLAQEGDLDRGEEIYIKRCLQCHGEDGDGLGPAAERLNPPPRDFSLGLYKFVTSGFDADMPNDGDMIRMITDGMPGTAMPGWGDMLSEQDILDVLVYIKYFAELEDEPETQTDFGVQVASSPESIAAGRVLFEENDRCTECHGAEGRGDGIKRLRDDNGDRTWPRNLTKPWTFRASNDPRDIFARISIGIPTTQMPSFADPASNKSLTIEERWNVANYVASLAKTEEVVNPANFVVQGTRAEGALPTTPDDEIWASLKSSTFMMVPQIVGGERFFTTANDTITVRALYDDAKVAIHLEWDDRTKSIPGDAKAASIADAELYEDAVAIQLPREIPTGMEKPYFLMGDGTDPVNLWRWSSGSTDKPESAGIVDAMGIEDQQPRGDSGDFQATGSFLNGTWRVVMTRSLRTSAPETDLQFEEGRFVPISFFAWDGSNSETGTGHSMTTWYWLQLKPAPSMKPIFYGALAGLLMFLVLIWWGAKGAARGRKARDDAA